MRIRPIRIRSLPVYRNLQTYRISRPEMKKFILSAVALFLLSAFLRAQEIDMSGSVAYDAVGSLVTLIECEERSGDNFCK